MLPGALSDTEPNRQPVGRGRQGRSQGDLPGSSVLPWCAVWPSCMHPGQRRQPNTVYHASSKQVAQGQSQVASDTDPHQSPFQETQSQYAHCQASDNIETGCNELNKDTRRESQQEPVILRRALRHGVGTAGPCTLWSVAPRSQPA